MSHLPSGCKEILGFPFTLVHANQPSSRVEGNLVSFRIVVGTAGFLSSSIGVISLLLRSEEKVFIPLEYQQVNGSHL